MNQLRLLAIAILWTITSALTSALAATATGPYYALPAWDQKLSADTRFVVLSNWGSEAVLDRETGLVWERTPSAALFAWIYTFGGYSPANRHCYEMTKGGRLGWRLPSLQELLRLQDATVSAANPYTTPRMTPGHPFQGIDVENGYWSSTEVVLVDGAYYVDFDAANTVTSGANPKTYNHTVWCVHGGSGIQRQ